MKLTTSMAFSPWDRITDLKTLCSREEFEKRYRASSPYALIPAK
jgi:hypothetical protein